MKRRSLMTIFISLLALSCSQVSMKVREPASNPDECSALIGSLLDPRSRSFADSEFLEINGKSIDITPIKEYIRSSEINKKLRDGIPLDQNEEELLTRLTQSLTSLPSSSAKSFRKVEIDSRFNSMATFLSKYEEGAIVTEDAFTSVALSENTKVWGDILRADIIFEIDGKRLKDISVINSLENEGIFLPGTKFRVKEIEGDMEYNPTVMIEEEDAIIDEIAHYRKYYDEHEEYFQEAGNYASDFNDKFRNIVDDEYGRFIPVEMDDWESLIRQRIVPIIRIKLEEVE